MNFILLYYFKINLRVCSKEPHIVSVDRITNHMHQAEEPVHDVIRPEPVAKSYNIQNNLLLLM